MLKSTYEAVVAAPKLFVGSLERLHPIFARNFCQSQTTELTLISNKGQWRVKTYMNLVPKRRLEPMKSLESATTASCVALGVMQNIVQINLKD